MAGKKDTTKKTSTFNLSDLKPNLENPRSITDEKLAELKKSITNFKRMMELRPIIYDEDMVILGGNMRYAALIALKRRKVPQEWVKQVTGLTEDEKRQFVIKDNVGFGEWDWDALKEDWELEKLANWGMEVPDFGDHGKVEQVNGDSDEWVGMPNFEAKDAPLKIVISFETEEDRDKFQEEYKLKYVQKQAKSWSTWWPFKDRDDLKSLKFENEDAQP